MRQTISFFLILLITSCSGNGNWTFIPSDPPKPGVPSDVVYFQNSEYGIFGGHIFEKIEPSIQLSQGAPKPYLVLTNSGGHDWKIINSPPNINGSISSVYLEDSTIICSVKMKLFKTNNLGATWQLIDSNEIKPWRIYVINASLFYFIDYNKETQKDYFLKSSLNTIDTVSILDPAYEYIFTKDKLHCYLTNSDIKTSKIHELSMTGDTLTTYTLDSACQIHNIVQQSNNLKTIVTENKIIQIVDGKLKDMTPSYLDKYKIKDFICDSNIAISICVNRNPQIEILTDTYFISRDFGKTWTQLQKEAGTNRKIFLLQKKELISYKYPQGMQRLKL